MTTPSAAAAAAAAAATTTATAAAINGPVVKETEMHLMGWGARNRRPGIDPVGERSLVLRNQNPSPPGTRTPDLLTAWPHKLQATG